MKREEWVWMPHAGHLIVGQDCRFHLNTYVGSYIVSTVGEYLPDAPVRESLARGREVDLVGIGDARRADYMKKVGYEKIGYDRLYETMVFGAEQSADGLCCPWRMADASELDMAGYNRPEDAFRGHMEMCERWAAK